MISGRRAATRGCATRSASTDDQPLLIYVGRLDGEKKPDVVVEAFRKLPAESRRAAGADRRGAAYARKSRRSAIRGSSRPALSATVSELARWLASADIYVSAMADETFGVSIVEAQASGLPVVGVAAGAMVDRVTDAIGRLGPVDDSDAMAANILSVWNGDRGRMGEIAQAEARQYSWDRSMEALFGQLYRKAFNARTQRLAESSAQPHQALAGVPAE